MADDGEIDIEGEFDFKLEVEDGFYDVNELPSKSANLLPEYTNPPWMLEQGWTLDMDEKSKATIEKMLLEEQQYLNGKTRSKQSTFIEQVVKKSQPAKMKPVQAKLQSVNISAKPGKNKRNKGVWTDEEKAMFLKGLEIFGRSWVKISELIPSRTSLQVKNYAQQHFKNLAKHKDIPTGSNKPEGVPSSVNIDLIQSVLESVETGQTTVKILKPCARSQNKPKTYTTETVQSQSFTNLAEKTLSNNGKFSINIFNNRTTSVLSHNVKGLMPKVFTSGNSSSDVMSERELHNNLLSGMLIENTVSNSEHCEPDTSKQIPLTIHAEHNYQSLPMEGKRPTDLDYTKSEQTSNSDSEELDIDIENDDEENPVLLTRSTSPTSVYEKLLKSAKVNLRESESDSEQSDKDEEELQSEDLGVNSSPIASLQANESSGKISPKIENEISHKIKDDGNKHFTNCNKGSHCEQNGLNEHNNSVETDIDLRIRNQKTMVNGVTSSSGEMIEFPIPTAPLTLNFDEISEEEQTIHSEFFDGRIAKTPDRYLKIRNHIIETWYKCRPVYLNKTAVRRGLKNCGDVNCIGRIHSYLECIGVINFGCELALYNNLNKCQVVNIKSESPISYVQHNCIDKQDLVSRCRKRRIRDGMGEWIDIRDSEGKTIEHKDLTDEDLKPKVLKVLKTSYDPFKLIPCQKFTEDKKAPFNVEINNSSLIVMDVHAHISKTEVIGMLGGRYNTDCGKLEIMVAVPCTSLSTGMQCEMDPVSQTQASEEISNKGLKVVGWYHSHPTFSPNPSIRDIETQIKFQDWFSKLGGNQFVGIIVSPYNRNNQGFLSEVNCLTISQDICPQLHCNIPYQFDYKVIYSIWNKDIVKSIQLLAEEFLTSYNHIKLSVLYKQSTGITCLQKMLESLKQYIEDNNSREEIINITETLFKNKEKRVTETKSACDKIIPFMENGVTKISEIETTPDVSPLLQTDNS